MAKPQEVVAVPIEERFRRDDFCILSAKQAPPVDRNQPLRFGLLGNAESGQLKAQLPYRFWGRWDNSNNQYGPSFRFDSFAPVTPETQQGVVKYLQQAKHVGPATAHALWDEYRGEAVRMLREHPEEAAEAAGTKRFTAQKAREAAEDLERMKAAEGLTIQLYGLFEGAGFGRACVGQAIKLWGARAYEILTARPHRAMALRGVGFLKADAFYIGLGKDPKAIKRQAYCLAYATLKASDGEGHVWVPWEQGVEYLKAAVAGTEVSPEKALSLAVRGRVMATRRDEQDRLWAADSRRAGAEEYCCKRLINIMTQG
jgi:hypothetical protein